MGSTIWRWRKQIVDLAQRRLARDLTETEKTFITSREGFVALEMIHDTVRTVALDELVAYLNSEHCSLCTGVCPECGGVVGRPAGSLDWILCSMCHATFRHP